MINKHINKINNSDNLKVKPFIKWLGGKRWLMPFLSKLLNGKEYYRYFEPFLGGGAFYFYFRPQRAFLSDINEDLINVYVQTRDNPALLISGLKKLGGDLYSYYHIRSCKTEHSLDRAVRFLYLNRMSFNGIYRINKDGQFNVPFGGSKRSPDILWRDNLLILASEALKAVDLRCSDFELALENAQDGDLVYCDPTYTVMHNNNGFRKYNEKCFSWADQERLAKCCKRAKQRGAIVIVSNAYHLEIQQLYKGFKSYIVERNSNLCPRSNGRKLIKEYLFIS